MLGSEYNDAATPTAALELEAQRWFMSTAMAPSGFLRNPSPTSVVEASPRAADEERSLEKLSAHALALTYEWLVNGRAWDASFSRGHGAFADDQRRIASQYLSKPAVDGWNVVLGAFEIARAWALRTTSTTDDPHQLDRNTRMRLAVCLNVSWKFQRSLCTHFKSRFSDVGEFYGWPYLTSGHTRELAHIAYGFLFAQEQEAFGGFSEENLDQVRALYQTLLRLEVDIVTTIPVFSLLTDNVQVRAENNLGVLYDNGNMSSDASMAARSIVPFFVRSAIASGGYEELVGKDNHGAEALACVSSACVYASAAMAVNPAFPAAHSRARRTRRFRRADEAVYHPPRFSAKAKSVALKLVEDALGANSKGYVRLGCYGDPKWLGHALVSEPTLRLAKVALRSAGAR